MDADKLRKQFHEETGIAPVFANHSPYIHYIKWLERFICGADFDIKNWLEKNKLTYMTTTDFVEIKYGNITYFVSPEKADELEKLLKL